MGYLVDQSKGMLGKPDSVELWEQIICTIPDSVLLKDDVQILCVAVGHGTEADVIAKRMLKLGRTVKEVKDAMVLLDKYSEFTNLAKQKGYTHVVLSDFLDWETDMKFDVVVGNYPYGDSKDSGGTLWGKFSEKVFNDMLKQNGIVAVVHPPSFIGKHLSSGKGKSDYTCFRDNQIHQLHLFDEHEKDKYFRNVGTKVCWYVAEKSAPTLPTKLTGYDNGKVAEFDVDFSTQTFLPQTVNKISMSIHKKLTKLTPIKFKQTRELHYYTMKKKGQVSDTASGKFLYRSHFSHRITRYANYKMADYNAIKVMVPQTSTFSKTFIDSSCNVSEDLFYVICKDSQEATKIKNYLTSDLVSYIGKVYRPGRNLGSLMIANLIPEPVDMNIFSKEEQEYIAENA